MVQRKVPSKLSIQADHLVKSGKRLGNLLRPSSPHHHHQDSKNKGADLKKKMKKSRSIKRSDFESLKSHTLIREVPQPGKPPPLPLDVPASAAATPQKQSPVRGSDASPNYMKSTSSFDARKERSQVSSKSSQSLIESKSPKKIPNNLKLSSVSDHKPAKTLARTSSLKLMRTLTKSPSFKPVRASTKKCSQVVICDDLDAQKPTCSSTLKDSKFPTYLALSAGATESEGTSAMKVCPYTYCSLNGHRHAPLPPLKCFLSARRRMLKTQKSMKLGCLSPRRAKSSAEGIKKKTEHITLDEKPAIQESNLNGQAINPLIEEDQMDFFIEIYAKETEDPADKMGRSKQNEDDQDEIDFHVDEGDGGKVEAPNSEIDSKGNLPNRGEVILTEMVAAEGVCSPSPTQEEESTASAELDGTDSEGSDMEWEEGQHSALDDVTSDSPQTNNRHDLEIGSSFANDNLSFHEEPIFKSDDIVSSYFDEIPSDERMEEFFEDDRADSGSGCSEDGSDSEGSYQNLGSDESLQVYDSQNSLISLTYDVLEESTTEEKDGNAEADDFMASVIALAPVEEPIDEPREGREVDDTFDQPCGVREETFVGSLLPKTEDQDPKQSLKQELPTADAGDGPEDEVQEDAAKSLIRKPTFDSLQGSSEADQNVTKEDNNAIQHDAAVKDGESNQALVDEDLPAETQVHISNKQSQNNDDGGHQNNAEKDHHETQSFKFSDSMDSKEQTHSGLNNFHVAENRNDDINEIEVEYSTMLDTEESLLSSENAANTGTKTPFVRGRRHPSEELSNTPNNLKIIRCNRPTKESEEPREFNPREPNYLPVEPDPEAEKVDLRHQMMDERKNAEEWMLDYALQQTVSKLAPARKRKVALLVEAFEKVIPIPKFEAHSRHSSAAFAHSSPRPIQACS